MGWFSDDKPEGDPIDDDRAAKPWDKPLSPEAAKKLLKAVKSDPKKKNQEPNPPKKGGWW